MIDYLDRVMDLETELLEARTCFHNAKSELLSLRSRLETEEEESKMLPRWLEVDTLMTRTIWTYHCWTVT
jgi:hypothetical protein